MKLQDLQRIDPNFGPNSFKSIPYKVNRLFEPDRFQSPEAHEAAGRELIRASISKSLGGKKVYGQEEIISVPSKSTKAQQMLDNLASGEAVIR